MEDPARDSTVSDRDFAGPSEEWAAKRTGSAGYPQVAIPSHKYERASTGVIPEVLELNRPIQRVRKKPRKDPKFARVFSLLAEVKSANENSCFVQALGAFREAVNQSRQFRPLKEIAFDTALEEAERLVPRNWRVAEALVSELPQLDLDRRVPISLRVDIERAARQECIATVLAAVEVYSDLEESKSRLERALRLYPGDASLENQLKVVTAAGIREQCTANLSNNGDASAGVESDHGLEQATVIAEVKALLETGPLSQARECCRQAAQKFPHSCDLWVLSGAIDSKDREVASLLRTGEDDLENWNVAGVRDAFLQASRLVPLDHELRGCIAGKLHAGARAGLESDWRSAETLLALSYRISPGHFIPPDLVLSLNERKQHDSPVGPVGSAGEPVPSFLDVEVLPYAESSDTTARTPGPRPGSASLALIDVQVHPARLILKRVAAYSTLLVIVSSLLFGLNSLLSSWPGDRRTARRPIYQIPSSSGVLADARTRPGTGILTVRSNVPGPIVFVDAQKYVQPKDAAQLSLTLPAKTYLVHAISPGYNDSGPYVVSVLTDESRTLDLRLTRKGSQVTVTASTLLIKEDQDWDTANSEKTLGSFTAFVHKYPASAHVPAAHAFMEELQWPYVDKHDSEVLKAFLSKYPDGAHGAEARSLLKAFHQPAPSALSSK